MEAHALSNTCSHFTVNVNIFRSFSWLAMCFDLGNEKISFKLFEIKRARCQSGRVCWFKLCKLNACCREKICWEAFSCSAFAVLLYFGSFHSIKGNKEKFSPLHTFFQSLSALSGGYHCVTIFALHRKMQILNPHTQPMWAQKCRPIKTGRLGAWKNNWMLDRKCSYHKLGITRRNSNLCSPGK